MDVYSNLLDWFATNRVPMVVGMAVAGVFYLPMIDLLWFLDRHPMLVALVECGVTSEGTSSIASTVRKLDIALRESAFDDFDVAE
jgi:hypothetical protein